MAKKASKPQETRSSSSTSAEPTQRMALRVRSREKMKVLSQLSKEDEENKVLSSTKKGKSKKKNDAKIPKKPPTAFFYFLEDFRKEYQEQNSDVKSMRDIGKACGDKWRTMTYEEKVQYYDIATEKRAEFDRAMSDYIKKKESGEDQDSEDSEYDE